MSNERALLCIVLCFMCQDLSINLLFYFFGFSIAEHFLTKGSPRKSVVILLGRY